MSSATAQTDIDQIFAQNELYRCQLSESNTGNLQIKQLATGQVIFLYFTKKVKSIVLSEDNDHILLVVCENLIHNFDLRISFPI
jgi:hypothetical protein